MDSIVKHMIRFPFDLYAKLREMAKLENRSINGQVISIIQAAIAEYERDHGPIVPSD